MSYLCENHEYFFTMFYLFILRYRNHFKIFLNINLLFIRSWKKLMQSLNYNLNFYDGFEKTVSYGSVIWFIFE